MTSRTNMTKAVAVGLVLGIVFAVLEVSSSQRLSDDVLVVTSAVVLILVTIVFVPSVKLGLVSALAAIISQWAAEFLFYSFTYGTSIAASMLPYSVILAPAAQLRLLVLPLSGMLGGGIAAELGPKSKTARKGKKEKRMRKKGQGTG